MDYRALLPPFLRDLSPEIYLSDNFITLDLETTSRDGEPTPTNPDNEIVTASWVSGLDGPGQEVFIRGNSYDMFPLIQACYEVDYIVAHNGKFDIGWLIRAGIDPHKILLADTQIAEYVLTGNEKAGKKGALKLDTLTRHYLGVGKRAYVDLCMSNGVQSDDLPPSLLERRNRDDIFQTRDLWLKLRARLRATGLMPVFYTRCILTPCLADVEQRGVVLDAERVEEEHKRTSKLLHEMTTELDLMLEGRNPRSVPQMQEFIYDVLKFPELKKKGVAHRPTGKEVLGFTAKTKKQQRFLALKKEFAQANADLTKNLDYFYGVCMEKGGVFYANFNQTITVTHRLSSSGIKTKFVMFPKTKSIQLQNSPRKYKRLYKPRHEGWKMVELDGAQIEFRVAGYLGQDVRICQDIIDGVDVHTFTAHVLNKCKQEEVTKSLRTLAKSETFKPLYGGQFGSDDQMAYYKAFREKYPGIAGTQKRWEGQALRTKKLVAETGLTFHFPNCSISSSGYNKDFPSICNYPVQNLATAEIVPIAVVATWHLLHALGMEAFINNTVHDSEIIEAPEHELEQVYEIGKWCFLWWVYTYLEEVYGIEFNVPLGVGFQAGSHWGEADAPPFTPSRHEQEFLTVKDGEVTVMAVPPKRMDGVDYSRLES